MKPIEQVAHQIYPGIEVVQSRFAEPDAAGISLPLATTLLFGAKSPSNLAGLEIEIQLTESQVTYRD